MPPSPKARKRKPAFAHDRTKPVPLREVVNFGPVTIEEMEAIGVFTLDQLEDLGFDEAARRWVEKFPERLNANAFLGLATTLDGIVWTKATPRHRILARNLVRELRAEYGLPQAKPRKRRR